MLAMPAGQAMAALAGSPVVFYKHKVPLKGIEANEIVFEVQSAFLDNIPINVPNDLLLPNKETFYSYYSDFNNCTEFLRESWLKSYILSVRLLPLWLLSL